MVKLPVIVGFGGFNAAGRSSYHQAYQRTVFSALSESKQQETLHSLSAMMNVNWQTDEERQYILDHTLIRAISPTLFDTESVSCYQDFPISALEGEQLRFRLNRKKLPDPIPQHWQIETVDDKTVEIIVSGENKNKFRLSTPVASTVRAAGQLPEGFDPAGLYNSRAHPRGLQLSVVGTSDALNSTGLDWDEVLKHLSPDQIGVYSASVMSQLDQPGLGGLLQARINAQRVTAKQVALGLGSMPADFINAYVIGSLGATGSISGACASFLYNLQAGVEAIRSGRCRVVIVGCSEAPITPEIIEGYASMGALATDEKLCQLDQSDTPDYRRASRPFGDNCGFTIAESTQQVVLMDDELAVELGATIYGAVPDVFVNADGYKKSISAPGAGNYLTMARAVAAAKNIVGQEGIEKRSFIQAHGSSTPQNRVTESQIFDLVARTFRIEKWPVCAVKAYLGHSLAPASGDQLINSLGVFEHGILPGIFSIDAVADDVVQHRLQLSKDHYHFETAPQVSFLNSKGFGGNNATACILSPQQVLSMLGKRYGKQKMINYQNSQEKSAQKSLAYHQSAQTGDFHVKYGYGKDILEESDLNITDEAIQVPDFGFNVDLVGQNIYKDMI